MASGRPFIIRFGEGWVAAGAAGVVFSWFMPATLEVFLAGCVAAAIGAILLLMGRRQTSGREAG